MSNFWDDAYNIVNKGYTATKTFLSDSFLNAQTPYQGPPIPKSKGKDMDTEYYDSYQQYAQNIMKRVLNGGTLLKTMLQKQENT